MHLHHLSVFILIRLCLPCETASVNKSIPAGRGFLIYRTISVVQQSCNCSMSFSCSCCRNVVILYTRREKNLCVNLTYQRNGLNVDVALESSTITTRTVTVYRPLQFCVYVPGCLFSSACVNIWDLSMSATSIAACLRLDVYAKKQLWQINYGCMNISTELPMMPTNGSMMASTDARNGQTEGSSTTSSQMMTAPMPEVGTIDMPEAGTAEVTEQANGMMQEMSSGQMTID